MGADCTFNLLCESGSTREESGTRSLTVDTEAGRSAAVWLESLQLSESSQEPTSSELGGSIKSRCGFLDDGLLSRALKKWSGFQISIFPN